MDKIKWWIIGIVIFILIVVTVLLLLPKDNSQNNQNSTNNTKSENIVENEGTNTINVEEENSKTGTPEKTIEAGYKEYYTVVNCISSYLDAININNSSYFSVNENGEKYQIISNDKIREKINALRSSAVNNNIQTIEEKNIFTPIDIIVLEQGRVSSYGVYGVTSNLNMEYLADKYYVVNLDSTNKAFSVQELTNNYSNVNQISATKLESIVKNDYNEFEYSNIDNEYKYKQIFMNIKRLLLVKPEVAYNFLDEDYKAKRFGSYEYFNEFVQKNREKLIGISPIKYKDDNTILLLMDQNSNWYQFEITGTMKYKVKIDNYIVLFDKDIEEYNKSSDDEKAKYDIKRWLKMLDSRDYKYAYEYLDETFRDNNYGTESDFEKFMKDNYPERYEYSVSDLQQEGNVYTAEVELNVEDEEFSDKYMTVIIRLDEGTDFTLSFDNQ